MTTEERVREVISEHLGVDESEVTGDATLESLGADSLDLADLRIALDNEFQLDIPEEEWDGLVSSSRNVSDLVQLIEKKIQ